MSAVSALPQRDALARESAADHVQPLLTICDLRKVYLTTDGHEVEALPGLTTSLGAGEFVSVVGPSGCGKSTLLRMLAGVIPPTGGEILYRGRPVHGPQDGIGVVFQSPVLLPWMRVLENVLLPARVLRMDMAQARLRAAQLLEMAGIAEFGDKYPFELSGGMQQRVAIVRGLIHDPAILLMDEPFGALDALTRERIALELQRIWLASRKTVFFITHSISEAVMLSDRVLVMSERPGRIIAELEIPFPRPRDFELTAAPRFGQLANQIRSLLGGL